jgi:hypothetical protein
MTILCDRYLSCKGLLLEGNRAEPTYHPAGTARTTNSHTMYEIVKVLHQLDFQ